MRRTREISACGWGRQHEQDWRRFVSVHPTNMEFYGLLLIITGLFAFLCLVFSR